MKYLEDFMSYFVDYSTINFKTLVGIAKKVEVNEIDWATLFDELGFYEGFGFVTVQRNSEGKIIDVTVTNIGRDWIGENIKQE